MEAKRIERWEGIALSCLAAAAAGFLLTQHDVPPTSQWYVWGLFVGVCGLVIATPEDFSARRLLTVGLPPAACLIVIMIARGVVSILIGGATAAVACPDLSPAQAIQAQNLERLAALYAVIFVGTIPAIIVAAFARGVIWRLLRSLWQADPNKLSRLEKVINSLVRIATVLGAGVIIGKV